MERKDIAIILGLFFIALVIRAVGVSNVCMQMDELAHWNKANLIIANNFVPTADLLSYANLFLPYLEAMVTVLFNGELNTLRIISVFFGSLSVCFLYLLGKALYDRKTGLLSALLLCFSAFHCLYSRTIYTEAFALFFIIAFLYFFCMSQRPEQEKKGMTYACLAGAMMGLAIDAKYISLFLIPAVLAYVLWTRRLNFKALLDKRVISIFVFAFLFFSPVLISLYATGVGLDPFYFQAFERFEKTRVSNVAISQLSPYELLVGSIDDFLNILARGAEILPWTSLFELSTILLFIIVLLSYFPAIINAERKGCFLIIPFITFYAFLYAGCAKHHYYLIYSLPFYFLMLSHLTTKCFERLKNYNQIPKNFFQTFVILLVTIMFVSYLVTGAASPYWDRGESAWTQDVVSYIKSDTLKDGDERHLMIGTLTIGGPLDYQFHQNKLSATVVPIIDPSSEYSSERFVVSLDKIEMLKPDYIVVKTKEYEYYFNKSVRVEMLRDYKLAFRSQAGLSEFSVLKRMQVQEGKIQPAELELLPRDGKDGKICHDIFKRSIPGVMKVGKPYTARVQIKNTGIFRADFNVRVHSDKYTIFVEQCHEFVTLNNDSIHMLKFKMIPLKEHIGELQVTANLYVKHEENGTYKVDSISDYVLLIAR